MSKKYFLALFALTMAVALVGCGTTKVRGTGFKFSELCAPDDDVCVADVHRRATFMDPGMHQSFSEVRGNCPGCGDQRVVHDPITTPSGSQHLVAAGQSAVAGSVAAAVRRPNKTTVTQNGGSPSASAASSASAGGGSGCSGTICGP